MFTNVKEYWMKGGGSDAYNYWKTSIPSLNRQIRQTRDKERKQEMIHLRNYQISRVKWASKKWPNYFKGLDVSKLEKVEGN